MASPEFPLDRREVMAGLGAAALAPIWPTAGRAQARPALALQAKADSVALRPNAPATAIWSLQGPELRFKRGETLDIAFGNELPVPAVLNWRGIDGVPAAEPLTGRPPLAAGGREVLQLPLRHAGTFLCDLNLLGDGQPRPSRARALVVQESETVAVDRDQILLIEFQPITLSGNTLAMDPATTLFNMYDNTTGTYLQGGQQDARSLNQWLAAFSVLKGESLDGIWIGEGLGAGDNGPESMTINSLNVQFVPEPSSIALLGAGLMVLGFAGFGFRRNGNRA